MATLLDRNFPDKLLEKCKKLTYESTGTKAVTKALEILFRKSEELEKKSERLNQLEQITCDIVGNLEQKADAEAGLRDAFKKIGGLWK